MSLAKLKLYFHTIRYLKPIQIYYQLYYRWRPRLKLKPVLDAPSVTINQITPSIESYKSLLGGSFVFLNKKKNFHGEIDWNFGEYGKLWTYNLNYFEFLNQPDCSKQEGVNLIQDFISKISFVKDGLEAFPLSLRIINWIKFIISNNVQDELILKSLMSQFRLLEGKIEYHLLGNHLLENLFALVSASVFFNDTKGFEKYSKKLKKQLQEQILKDGGHFELSPMYHQLMLFRALDAFNLMKNSPYQNDDFLDFLKGRIQEMLGWLKEMTFSNGEIPLFNDSAEKIAPRSTDLFAYAERLNIEFQPMSLSASGYRVWKEDAYELVMDAGEIGAAYIPGHAHSDALSFVMNVANKPFLVDTGTSTYEKGNRRDIERSTSSHNTVVVEQQNQSQVWAGFRVGKRASVVVEDDLETKLVASHDGYENIGVIHKRVFLRESGKVLVRDKLSKRVSDAKAYFHFHPDVLVSLDKNVVTTSLGVLSFEGATNVVVNDYYFAPEFNSVLSAKQVVVDFVGDLNTTIETIISH